ncbi:MAG TPA: hypothetical protein VEK11_07235 [Thermoanaerobaculia bacterium]|nr:hypothetical protein [Thermoanaerobaculia bacterium]
MSTKTTQMPPRKRDAQQRPAKPDLQKAIRETAKDVVTDAVFEKRPYLKMAFANPYNLSLFLGTLAAAAATMNPILAAAAIGGELLWLMHGSESKTLRRLLWDPRFEKVRLALEAREREERLKALPQEDRERVYQLVGRQADIHRLASQNPSFTGELLRSELIKTRRLVDAFVEMAITCARYEAYLETIDFRELEHDRAHWERRIESGEISPQESDIAKKNLAVIRKRLEKLSELRDYLRVARGQLDLIENSFQLIADQIVMMQSPAELTGQLDDLLDGVESIRQTALDTEKILSTMGV